MRIKSFNLLVISLIIQSCNSQTVNVELYQIYSPINEVKVYEQKSLKPYTGKFVSTSKTDKVEIDFKDGKINGNYLRTFSNGDTIKYSNYKDGLEVSSLDFIYDNRKLDYKELIKNEPGDSQDFKLFIKTCDFIINEKFNELYSFLNPLHRSYEETFQKLEYLFGPLKNCEIKEVQKKFYRYNESVHITAKINFEFKKRNLEASFKIIEEPFEITGQAFQFPVFDFEFDKNAIVNQIIKIFNNKDTNKFIALTSYTPNHEEQVKTFLNQTGEISSDYEFLNSHFSFYNETLLIQDYLVEINNEKTVMSLIFEIKDENKLELININLLPYYREYSVPHRIM